MKISVVINTLNEEESIARAIKSVKWADEVIVCDMHSDDQTVVISKKLGAKIILHPKKDYVELARNFNIAQANGDWVLILDPDEEIPKILADKLREISETKVNISFVEIPRKNIIFNKWMTNSMWWPDYNIRFFKKGFVVWGNEIHRPPKASGQGISLEAEEKYGIIHNHYINVSQFIRRLDRYTTAQADDLKREGYKFKWSDLLTKPMGEFLSRYFAESGYKDGLHGLALSLLQAFSFLIMYLKIWEREKFYEEDINLAELKNVTDKEGKELTYWFRYSTLSKNYLKRFLQKIGHKIS